MGGGTATIHLRDSVALDSCQHTLCAGGKLAAEEGIGLHLAPYDGESFLFSSLGDRSTDIVVSNAGVVVLPTASCKLAFPISHGHIQNDATRAGENISKTFNHADHKRLRHMPECTHAPEAWGHALKEPRDVDNLRATALRVPSQGTVPVAHAPGDAMCVDGWSNQVGHIHGGQKQVLGTFDLHSRLDKSYLMHAKSEAAGCYEAYFSWNNSLGVRYKNLHGDNAPDLIKGESEQVCRRWGVNITSSAPYEPRQNSAMERRWRQHGEDTRVALAQSNFLDHPSGERYWWYAWRDAEMKGWCVPFQRDGKWVCPWQLHTGHRPNPTVYKPFGMLCYTKEYSPRSKTALQGRECRYIGYSATQKAFLL